jgi:hypothetical protein
VVFVPFVVLIRFLGVRVVGFFPTRLTLGRSLAIVRQANGGEGRARGSAILKRIRRTLAREWAGAVYAAMVPIAPGVPEGAAAFVEDLWRAAPLRISLPSICGALLIALSPPFLLGRPTTFHRLPQEERQRLLAKLMTARPYLLRLLFYGVKSQALVAVLRDERCRRDLGLPLE